MPDLTRDCIALSRGVGILNMSCFPMLLCRFLSRCYKQIEFVFSNSLYPPEGNRLNNYATRGFISQRALKTLPSRLSHPPNCTNLDSDSRTTNISNNARLIIPRYSSSLQTRPPCLAKSQTSSNSSRFAGARM